MKDVGRIALKGNSMRFAYWVLFLVSVAAAQGPSLYDPHPEQIWNRVHGVLHVRVAENGQAYGSDGLDPLLWRETEYLLSGDSHRQALAVLDEFLSRRAEGMITDSVRRAVFQHDLWAVFDWLDNLVPGHEHAAERGALQERLAQLIRRVALNRAEIERLPDNLAEAAAASLPNLPADLFQADGPWVCLCRRGSAPTAARHTSEFSGRSFFVAFLKLPGGREQTLAYLESLREYPEPWLLERDVSNAPPRIVTNPALPQFPPGTRLALARRMMLIDRNGEIVPTRLTESVQIRDYKTLWQSNNSEFRLSREKLFSGEAGGLRAIGSEDKEFPVFSTHGIDPFEMPRKFGELERHRATILDTCASCHRGSGIHAVLSYVSPIFEGRMPELISCRTEDQAIGTVYWKRQQHNLGLLQGLGSR